MDKRQDFDSGPKGLGGLLPPTRSLLPAWAIDGPIGNFLFSACLSGAQDEGLAGSLIRPQATERSSVYSVLTGAVEPCR